MKLKAILFACAVLGAIISSNANSKDDLKTHFAQVKTFVQENPYKIAKIAISGHALAFSIFSLCEGIKFLSTRPYERTKSNYLRLFFIPTTLVASYYMLNDGLNNKPNEAIRSLIQKAKAQLQRPKVSEQK